MRPANKISHEVCEEMEEYGPSFAAKVIEADRAALVAEIVEWLREGDFSDTCFGCLDEASLWFATNIEAKFGGKAW